VISRASPSDAELVERARAGRTEAFGRLVERHQDYIYNAVRHLVSDRDDAEDIAQQVFVKAYEGLESFAGRAKFSTWLYGIMLNCVRTYRRRRGRATVFSVEGGREEGAGDPPSEADGPERATMRGERVQRVRDAIAGLDPDHREIIVLREIRGLSYEELAEVLEVAPGTVKSRLYRARRQLKEKLEPYWATQE
jgi:RNA polymerase sigma-70 factor (ECF subfamily)